VRFEALVAASEAVKQTRSRQQKVEHLAACIAQLGAEPPPGEVAVPGLLGGEPLAGERPGPDHTSLRVGVAYLAGELPQGRIGLGPAAVFKNLPSSAREAGSLSLADVDAVFEAIARVSGAGAVRERMRLWLGLLERSTALEQTFLRKLVVGELRQGALESLVADAVAKAARVSASSVRRALMLAGSLPSIAEAAMTGGEAALGRYHIELFRPLQPMLAHSAETPEAALASLSRAVFEYKLDGARIQVHKQGGEVRVYTRQLSDVTAALPEVVELALALPSQSLVLDGEVLSLRPDGAPEPFQVTMRRFGRKLDVARSREAQPLSPFFFDLLHRDGADLIDLGTSERLALLDEAVPAEQRMPRLVSDDPAAAASFFDSALDQGHEGVMAKALDASYAAGRRGQSWLKVKSHHTLDLVVLGVEWGSGRRQGWLSNLHLGARDPAGGFVMVGKTFKGLTDALLTWQTAALLEREVARDGYAVYVRPELVVEIAFNDVQQSPHYPGGVALRFARVKRYRPDKSALEADTIHSVRALAPLAAPTTGGEA
jgi:ATP-dependent DNA ligase I